MDDFTLALARITRGCLLILALLSGVILLLICLCPRLLLSSLRIALVLFFALLFLASLLTLLRKI